MIFSTDFAPAGKVLAFAYYLVSRHTNLLTMPSNCLYLDAWGSRPFVSSINGPCYGVAYFGRRLTAREQIVYGLLPCDNLATSLQPT